MYVFVYRILFEDGTVRMTGDECLSLMAPEEADKIVTIDRVEVHTSDWRAVTTVAMRRIRDGIEARRCAS